MQKDRLEQLLVFLKNNPRDSFVNFAIALEYIKKQDDAKALEYFADILQYDPEYTGAYYHVGKLYERMSKNEEAEKIYAAGMKVAQRHGEQHAYSELQEALNALKDVE